MKQAINPTAEDALALMLRPAGLVFQEQDDAMRTAMHKATAIVGARVWCEAFPKGKSTWYARS